MDIHRTLKLTCPKPPLSFSLRPGCPLLSRTSVNDTAATQLNRAEHVILDYWLPITPPHPSGPVGSTSFVSLESLHLSPCPLLHSTLSPLISRKPVSLVSLPASKLAHSNIFSSNTHRIFLKCESPLLKPLLHLHLPLVCRIKSACLSSLSLALSLSLSISLSFSLSFSLPPSPVHTHLHVHLHSTFVLSNEVATHSIAIGHFEMSLIQNEKWKIHTRFLALSVKRKNLKYLTDKFVLITCSNFG